MGERQLFTFLQVWLTLVPTGIRIDFLGACYSCGVAIYMVYIQNAGDASNTGFAMNMAGE
jgi:hypothetical protein